MTATELEPGEKLLNEWRSDRARFWRDHAVMAVLGMAGCGLVLWWLEVAHIAIGALGALLAIAVRGLYLQGEQLQVVWRLTDRRVILPSGITVGLMEIETRRRLLGDVQLITRAGDKHLIRHLADPQAALDALEQAIARRARRRGP